MKLYSNLFLVLAIVLLGAFAVNGQEAANGAQTAETLRAQLRDVQYKQAEIEHRLNELEYELKPENIERYFAGTGSTRPEELREHRRKQLQLEKDTLNKQMQSLADSKIRLEAAIARADSLAYQQSAFGSMSLLATEAWDKHRGLVLGGTALIVALCAGMGLLLMTRRRRSPAL